MPAHPARPEIGAGPLPGGIAGRPQASRPTRLPVYKRARNLYANGAATEQARKWRISFTNAIFPMTWILAR